jgi:predicted DNA repair protein MutK
MSRRAGALAAAGRAILRSAPWLMKALAVAGTAAMFLVGGGILVHGWPVLHHALQSLAGRTGGFATLVEALGNGLAGLAAGAAALLAVTLGHRLWRRWRAPAAVA